MRVCQTSAFIVPTKLGLKARLGTISSSRNDGSICNVKSHIAKPLFPAKFWAGMKMAVFRCFVYRGEIATRFAASRLAYHRAKGLVSVIQKLDPSSRDQLRPKRGAYTGRSHCRPSGIISKHKVDKVIIALIHHLIKQAV
jgi:hypothetical protein